MKQYTVFFSHENRKIAVHSGKTILEAAIEAGVTIASSCAGKGTCGKCTVRIEPEGIKVLACKYIVNNDITVIVPIEKPFLSHRKISDDNEIDIKLKPSICKLHTGSSISSPEQAALILKEKYPESEITFADSAAFDLPDQEDVTIVYRKNYVKSGQISAQPGIVISGTESGDTLNRLYGAAIDIGTTTVVAKLFDLNKGLCLATAAAANPQSIRGDDVISRINYASEEEGLKDLQKIIINCLNSLIEETCKDARINPAGIYEICIAGNTTMNHILLALPVKQLGEAPYKAYSLEAQDVNPACLGLHINSSANVHTIENIAGFVGSDTTAAALAVGMHSTDKMTLLVDIGTNGELVMGANGKLYAASCAAGPALEGARISQGSRAVEGAVEGVEISGDDIALEVIGGGEAVSICGSGLIDTMAVLRDLGLVDSTGRFADIDELTGKVSDKILARLTSKDDQPAFILAANDDNEKEPVIFTQKDVRETQLAKAAIRAGIIFLQKKTGIEDSEIDQVLLAGAFGNYIDRESAMRIGLLPNIPVEKVHFVGNAAGTGCQAVLLNSDHRIDTAELVKKIEYIEIANEMEFQMVFADALLFE